MTPDDVLAQLETGIVELGRRAQQAEAERDAIELKTLQRIRDMIQAREDQHVYRPGATAVFIELRAILHALDEEIAAKEPKA